MVIDFHVHMFPDKLAPRTIPLLAERAGLLPYTDGTLISTLERMKVAGVTKIVHQNIATNPKQMHNVNSFAIASNERPEVISFGSVHPQAPDYEAELDRLLAAGISGIKLHPDYQCFFIDDPAMQPLYEAILKRGFILLFHSGLDYGLPEPVHATPEAIGRTLGLFSGEKVVFAHMAGFTMPQRALEHVIGRDVYIDTSCSLGYITEEERLTVLQTHNPNKILFATDCPWGDFATEIEGIRKAALPEELKEKILHRNAEALLGL